MRQFLAYAAPDPAQVLTTWLLIGSAITNNMGPWLRFGIAVGALGGILILLGLFPTIMGIEPSPGFGILRTLTVLGGFSVMTFGAFVFVQSAYYPRQPHTLAQKIAVRLSMTGLLGSAAAGLADVLGYGSNPPGPQSRPVLGVYQIVGMVSGFILASLGVLLFVLLGDRTAPPARSDDLETTDDDTRPGRG